jgi:hypothetical protein
MEGNKVITWGNQQPEARTPTPTANQYRVLQARATLMDHGLEDDGVEAIDRLLASMGYELRESDG